MFSNELLEKFIFLKFLIFRLKNSKENSVKKYEFKISNLNKKFESKYYLIYHIPFKIKLLCVITNLLPKGF